MADVFFDYTCGYSNRGRHWLDALEGADLVWRPFSLLEQNAGDAGPSVFDRDEYVDNPSLIALAVHEQVRAQDGDVDAYRQRMFTAWHEQPGRLSTDDIVGFGRDAGLRDFDRAAGFASVASKHAAAAGLGVFGTPTLVLGPGRVVFIKLDAVPDSGRASRLWDAVDELAATGQDLRGVTARDTAGSDCLTGAGWMPRGPLRRDGRPLAAFPFRRSGAAHRRGPVLNGCACAPSSHPTHPTHPTQRLRRNPQGRCPQTARASACRRGSDSAIG